MAQRVLLLLMHVVYCSELDFLHETRDAEIKYSLYLL